MQIDFPLQVDSAGRTAETLEEEHVRDLIEQVLFTDPGERVNRPTFGAGIRRLIFAGNNEPLATATQFIVQGSLQQWLGELIDVEAVEVESEEATLTISVRYRIRRSQKTHVAQFSREV